MIDVKMLNGDTAAIAPSQFVRLRPVSTPAETGSGARSVLFAGEMHLILDDARTLAAAFGREIAIAEFTTPNGLPIFVAAAKVQRVLPPNPSEHNPEAHAVLDLGGSEQQVREAVAEAQRRVEAAAPTS